MRSPTLDDLQCSNLLSPAGGEGGKISGNGLMAIASRQRIRTSASRLAMVNPMVTLPGKKCRVLHTQYIHANGCLVLQHAWIRPISPLTPALTLSCSQP
ncbi:hypothetical protein CPSG_05046 [Coccidioides posadasii str. Silveira]|uniref:Uncharacterized protein n=1 Tax=Coccidioides posadasii (strain RMSCC 757 / Silveira) TaxID=443226 RepID=E9D616_COCPS|nr:hypothetical protein CPSG_05046 [Coccidioides posadasii str. Silveira]